MHYELRKHQKRQNRALLDDLKIGAKHILYVASTGYGKSVAMWELIGRDLEKGLKVLVLAPRRGLVFDLEKTFNKYNPRIIMGSVDRGSNDSSLILASIQTTNRRLKTNSKIFEDIDKIYIDEVHIGGNFPPRKNSQFDLLYQKYWASAVWIGLTATPITQKGEKLGGWGEIVSKYDTAWLIKKGFLANFDYFAPKPIVNVANMEVGRDGEFTAQAMSALNTKVAIGSVVEKYDEVVGKEDKVLIFTASINQAEMLKEDLKQKLNLDNLFIIHSNMRDVEQRRILEEFKMLRYGTLINVSMLTTGFDDSTINILMIARPIKTLSLAIQIWGRGLRKNGAKVCKIYDLCDVCRTCIPTNLYINKKLAYPLGKTLTPKSVFHWDAVWQKAKKSKQNEADGMMLCDPQYALNELNYNHPKVLKRLKKQYEKSGLKNDMTFEEFYADTDIIKEQKYCGKEINIKQLKRTKIEGRSDIKTIYYCPNCFNAVKTSEVKLLKTKLMKTKASNESKGVTQKSVNEVRTKELQRLVKKHTYYKTGYAFYVIKKARAEQYLARIDNILNLSDLSDKLKIEKIKRLHNGK